MKSQSVFRDRLLNYPFDKATLSAFGENEWRLVESVPGYLSKLEAFFLFENARTLTGSIRDVDQPEARAVVEIGSYAGRSSVAIALGLMKNENDRFELFCVDPGFHESFQGTIERAGVSAWTHSIEKSSVEAAREWPTDRGIAMLFIDGNHERHYVEEDFREWGKHLVPGGWVAFHDWYLNGVKDTVTARVFMEESFQDVVVADGNLVGARKLDTEPLPEQSALKMRIFWALQTGSFSPWRALAKLMVDWLRRPFGRIRLFFTVEMPSQIDGDR